MIVPAAGDPPVRLRAPNERGIALAVAIFALVVIGAMVAGNFFAGRLEQQSGQNAFFAGQAAEAAEAGLTDAMATTSAAALDALSVSGPPLDLGTITLNGGVIANRQVSRLTSSLFLIRALGTRQDASGAPLARRSVGLLVRVATDSSTGTAVVVPLAERGWVQLY